MINDCKQSSANQVFPIVLISCIILLGLYITSIYNYLLFHTLVELFGVIVSFSIFILAWNTRRLHENQYLLFFGLSFLFSGALELLHTLTYKDIEIFQNQGANLPTQLWISFRYVLSVSFLAAPFFMRHTFKISNVTAGYTIITCGLISAIFLGYFPDCYIEGNGLTSFKIYSEYVILVLFLVSLVMLIRHREFLDGAVMRLLAGAILLSIFSEILFTLYTAVTGAANMIGHFLLLASTTCVFRAIIVTGMSEPTRLLFRDLKLSSEKIEVLNQRLQKSITKLEESNRELEAFTYSVSHDLRAPLRTVSGFSKIVLDDYAEKLDKNGKHYLSRIFESTERMSNIITDLLRLSTLSRQEMNRIDIDLSSLAESVWYKLHESNNDRKIDCVIAKGARALADQNLMRIVFTNLFENARKFSEKTTSAWVEFGYKKEEGNTIFFIRDNGAGFDQKYVDKMFIPFQRLHIEEEFKGTGIGLAIVERIIKKHGGKVWAEGEIGKGATIYFTL